MYSLYPYTIKPYIFYPQTTTYCINITTFVSYFQIYEHLDMCVRFVALHSKLLEKLLEIYFLICIF
jgi:hypothetical protein